MSIAAVRQRLEAFAAGEVSEQQLRAELRGTIAQEPQLRPAAVALVTTLAQAGRLSVELEARLLSDIGAAEGAAAPDAESMIMSSLDARPILLDEPIYAKPLIERARASSAASVASAALTGSSWETPQRLAEPAAALHIGSVLKHRFELAAELGRGGMGVVYKALDRTLAEFEENNPYVAIKVLNDELKRHPLAVRSLQSEAGKAQKLAHPNIVTVFDFDRDGGNVYMVMELLPGRSLDQILHADAPSGVPLARARDWLRAMAAALSYAHAQGIVHADFKPSNVFVTDSGQIKVLDFGVARALHSLHTPGAATGIDAAPLGALSPSYASIEMLQGEPPDVRDDVYALACVTYEMLTGHHPFKDMPADKAREANLQPAAPRKLSRAQWQVLRQGLSFNREQRCASVQALADGVSTQPRSRAWLPIAAGVLALVLLLAIAVSRQWFGAQPDQLRQRLADGDATDFEASLATLRGASDEVRARALADEQVRQRVLAYYGAQIAAASAAPNYDFARARAALADLKALLPDSKAVADMAEQLEQTQQSDIEQQVALRDAALARGTLLATPAADDLSSILARLRRIDPQNPALNDPKIAAAYLAAAKTASDAGQADVADTLLQTGLHCLPNDAALMQAKVANDAQLKRQADAKRVAQLEEKLGSMNPDAADLLDQVLTLRDDFKALAALSPTDAAITRLHGNLQSATLERVQRQLAAGDIASARDLLLAVRELLPEQAATAAEAALLQATRARDERALDLLDQLQSAVLADRLVQGQDGGALALYGSLQQAGASADILSEARDLMAYGYLRQARSALAAGDVTGAQQSLNAALAIPPDAIWQARAQAEQQLIASHAASTEQNAAAAAPLAAARERLVGSLRVSTLGAAELQSIADALDQLQALGAAMPELDAAVRQAEDRVLPEITRVQQQSGEAQAQLYAREASSTLIVSERIAQVAKLLRGGDPDTDKAFAPPVLAARDQLAQLLAKPQTTQQWVDQLRAVLDKLSAALPVNDATVRQARQRGVALLLQAAADASAQQHYAPAASLLELARQLDPQASELAPAAAALAAARAASQLSTQKAELLKQTLAEQARAGNVAGATVSAAALRRALAGSPYVSTDLPQQLIQAYLHSARSQALAGNVDDALQTLAEGRRKLGNATDLKNLEARYVTLGNAYDRLSTAVVLNVKEQRGYLDSLKASEGTDYRDLERMLARTLANRIADMRAAERPAVAAKLLQAGQSLFTDYAPMLEQGRAGVLPDTPLAVTEE